MFIENFDLPNIVIFSIYFKPIQYIWFAKDLEDNFAHEKKITEKKFVPIWGLEQVNNRTSRTTARSGIYYEVVLATYDSYKYWTDNSKLH